MREKTQDDYIKTALRVPPKLHARIHESARRHGRTFNAEILQQLQLAYEDMDAQAPSIDQSADEWKSQQGSTEVLVVPAETTRTMGVKEIKILARELRALMREEEERRDAERKSE